MTRETSITETFLDNGEDYIEMAIDAGAIDIAKSILGDNFDENISEVIGAVPFVKTLKGILKLISATRTTFLIKKFNIFLITLNTKNFNRNKFDKLSEKKKQELREIIVATLDKQTSDKQSAAFSYLFNAYIEGDISKNDFVGIAHELENINPLVFEFDSEWSHYSLDASNRFGHTTYLPAAFYTAETPETENIQGLSFSSKPFATPIAITFLEYVHRPMRDDYEKTAIS